jgi:hypothetical protein
MQFFGQFVDSSRVAPRDLSKWDQGNHYARRATTMEQQPSRLSPQQRRQRNRDRNREEMKAAILDAARAVMREEGVFPRLSKVWVYLSMLRVMRKRLAREQVQPTFHYRHVA